MDLNNLGINSLGKKEFSVGQSAAAGKSLLLDGVDGHMTITRNSGLPMCSKSSKSWAMNIKIPSTIALGKIIFSEGFSGTIVPVYAFGVGTVNKDRFRVFFRNDTNTTLINAQAAATSFSLDTWVKMIFIDDAGVCTLYVDGTEVLAGSLNYTPSGTFLTTNQTTLGCLRRTTNTEFANIYTDNVCFYDHALDSTERTDWNAGNYPTTGLVCRYNMNDNVLDQTANANNGTLVGGASYSTDTPS